MLLVSCGDSNNATVAGSEKPVSQAEANEALEKQVEQLADSNADLIAAKENLPKDVVRRILVRHWKMQFHAFGFDAQTTPVFRVNNDAQPTPFPADTLDAICASEHLEKSVVARIIFD